MIPISTVEIIVDMTGALSADCPKKLYRFNTSAYRMLCFVTILNDGTAVLGSKKMIMAGVCCLLRYECCMLHVKASIEIGSIASGMWLRLTAEISNFHNLDTSVPHKCVTVHGTCAILYVLHVHSKEVDHGILGPEP